MAYVDQAIHYSNRHAPRLISGLALWRPVWITRWFDPYRPELHYMRGPGPKWHAKHDLTTAGR